MSYSIFASATTKAAALRAIADEFDAKVLPTQPVHARDRETALATAHAVAGMAAEAEDGQVFAISLNGSISVDPSGRTVSLSVGCSAYPMKAPVTAATAP